MADFTALDDKESTLLDVQTLLQALLVDVGQVIEAGSTVSTTSTAYSQLGGLTVTKTIPADSYVYVEYTSLWGASAGVLEAPRFGISEDSTTVTQAGVEMLPWSRVNNTDGRQETVTLRYIFQPTAGSHTYRALYRLDAGSGTIYAYSRVIQVAVFQKGA
jgi:hypothetical protein